MARKNDINNINLKINNINTYIGNEVHINISWESDLGFGVYQLTFMKNGQIIGDSENMDSEKDKEFLKKLLQLLVDKIEIKR